MDTKKDRRIRKSKESLKNALIELMENKSINNITVKELVVAADLNRSTFYNYYSDIPDMIEKLEMELYNEFLNTLKLHVYPSGTIVDISQEAHKFIEDMCNVIKNNYSLCKSLFSKNGDLSFLFKIEELVENHIKNQLREVLDLDLDFNHVMYVYSFLKSGYIGVLKEWMKDGCIESSQEIANLVHNLVKSIIDNCKK